MTLLSNTELMALAARGVIRNVDPEFVNAASIDITLGSKILVEKMPTIQHAPGMVRGFTVSLKEREPLNMLEVDCTNGFLLLPGQFILAHSEQEFYLPNDISAEYKLKSSMARVGLNHALAGWCDAGWTGSVLTLELMNVTRAHAIKLHKGDRIGQMIFFHHTEVPEDRSYAKRGRYNNDTTVKGMK